MEIDFLGLHHSKNSSYNLIEQQKLKADRDFSDSGGNISLSLCSTSLLDCQTQLPAFPEKTTWKFPLEKMITTYKENAPTPEQPPPAVVPSSFQIPYSTVDYLYNYNHKSTIFRNTFELPNQPVSLPIFCSGPARSFHDVSAQKADFNMYMAGNASKDNARKGTGGYTPTVAMARRATLARFLEKRLHRLTQTKKSHFMGRSLNVSEDCSRRVMKCNNKKKEKSIIMS